MRTRTMLLTTAAAGVSLAAGFATLSQAGDEGSVTPGPSVVSRPLAAPTADYAAAIPRLAATLPSFSRPRSSVDVVRRSADTPREAVLFGSRGDLDTGASRRVYAAHGRAIFAVPSRDRSKVCFALTEDRADGVWALNFCSSSAALRASPMIWNVNVVRAPTGRLLVAWGIASHAVSRVTSARRRTQRQVPSGCCPAWACRERSPR
jgi:hypothetical protein